MKLRAMIWMITGLTLAWANAYSQNFEAGFAAKTITPDETHMACEPGQYADRGTGGRREPAGVKCWGISLGGHLGQKAKGIRDDIYARSLALKGTQGNTFTLTYLDLPGISNRIIKNILDGVAADTSITCTNHFIGATHSHSAPDLQGLYGGVPWIYKRFVESQTISAIKKACNNLESVNVFVSGADASTPNRRNRRGHDDTDLEITLVEFKEIGGAEKTVGSLINFAAHPIVQKKDNLISRDFCGYVVDRIESSIGGTAIFANAVLGDVLGTSTAGGDTVSRFYGEEMADRALDSRNTHVMVEPPEIKLVNIPWSPAVTGWLFQLVYYLGWIEYDAFHEDGELKISSGLGYLRLGKQIQGVMVPGESTTRNGYKVGSEIPTNDLAIKEAMKTDNKLFLGLTGDSLGYFVPSDEWQTGRNNNYEELVSIGKAAGDDIRDKLRQVIRSDNF